MKKMYHLSTCSTCKKIIDQLPINHGIELIDIKANNISEQDLEKAGKYFGSFESIFSRRAMKFRSMGLNEKILTENDYKNLILSEYTFLKRPVTFIDGEVFAGNTKDSVTNLINKCNE
jgi:arsenate reductase